MPIDKNDWRLTGQEKYLQGVDLTWKQYKKYRSDWEHDHCAFCQAKFMEPGNENTAHEGYATKDNYHWICKVCFDDFKGMFQWQVRNERQS